MIVKIVLPEDGFSQATISTPNGVIMYVEPDRVARRFSDRTQRVGFFHAQVSDHGSFEIGEHAKAEAW